MLIVHQLVPMRLFKRHCLLAALYLLLPPLGVMARQQLPPSFAGCYMMHYDDENGLLSNDVTGFYEDVNGYYWFSTQFGLVRFDGKEFKHFYTSNLPSLGSNRIYSLNSNTKGRIYFADEGTGVHVIESDGRIVPVPGIRARYNFLMSAHGFVLDIRKYLKNGKDSIRIMEEVRATKHYLPMHEFYPDSSGNAWFLSGHDISYFKEGYFNRVDYYDQVKYTHFYIKNTLFAVDTIGRVRAYREGKKSSLTFSLQKALSQYKTNGHFDIKQARFCSNQTGTFLQYHDKIFALSFDGQTVHFTLLLQDLALPPARDIYYSERNRLYIVRTRTKGFYLIRQQPFTTHNFAGKDDMENSFVATVETQPMQVLTSSGVLFSKHSARRIYDYNLLVFNTILKDSKQQIWFMGGDTLFCMNDRLQEQKRWIISSDTYLKSLLEDDKGTIWYCTNSGLARIDSGKVKFLYTDYRGFDRSQCMFFFNDTCIWLGTTDGLFAYNKKNHSITPYPEMDKKYVRHIYRARDGSIWIGTYGQGFYTYRNGRFIPLPLDRMSYLATAHCFMEDDKGFFWIPTNKGLFQVPKVALEDWLTNNDQQVYYHYYDKNDGFATNEFNGGSSPVGIRLQDGTFSLPSMNGLVWFKPLDMQPALPVENIYIDRVMADTQAIKYANEIKFDPGSRKISFHISSPFFGNMVNFYPEFRIRGVDKLWTPVAVDNAIVINYLPPGKYTLDIRLRRGFGAHEYTSKAQTFSIAPFFTETMAFKILIGLGILAVLGLIVYWRFRELRKGKQKLALLVAERTQELNTANQKQKQTIAELKVSEENLHQSNLLKDKLTSVMLHDIRSPLRFMSMLSKQLHSALSSGDNQPLTALTTELKKSSDQLDVFTREFLVWITTQQKEFQVRNEYVYIQEMFQETEAFYRNILNWNHNTLILDIEEDIRMWTDKQLMKIILHNLIDNANKHAEYSTIRLSAFLERDDQLIIKVTDAGKGMTFQELQALQSRLADEKDLYATEGANNLGYRIIRDFVAKLKGRVVVESVFNKGTTVTIIFPV